MNSSAAAKLAEFRAQYLKQLNGRLAAIRAAFAGLDPAAWQVEQAQTLHRLVHGLTGSAGTFGLAAVSDVARRLENALANTLDSGQPPDAAAWQAILEALDRLARRVTFSLASDAPELPSPELPPRPQRAPLVHLVEDDLPQAEFLRQRLLGHGFRVRHFSDPADFSAVIRSKLDERPAAVVMDMIFAQGDTAGATTVATLGLGAGNGVPVVFVSVRDDIAAHLAAYRAGASRYLVKPVDPDQLCAQLDVLTRMPPQPLRVLLVDNDDAVLDYHAAVLREAGFEVLAIARPLETLDALARFVPDVVVLDVYMPEASGPELAAVIREHDRHMNLPILFLSAETDLSKQLLALNLGGDDFLVKPVRPEHLVAAVSARARRARQNTETLQRLQITLYEREREHLALDQHALVSVADAAGLITYANPAFCLMSGYRLEELLKHSHNILNSGLHPVAFYQDMWSTIKSGKVWHGEIRDRRKDGSFCWMKTTITPFVDADGNVYQYVAIRTDITAIKETQESLRIAKERLRRSQIYANVGCWDWDIQTGDLYWSERIAALFGYAEGELETSYDNFLAAVHPDDRQRVIDAVNTCIAHDQLYDIEHRVVWPDGTVHWLQERGAVTRDADGKAAHMLGVVQDIGGRKAAEAKLVASREAAERANRAKSDFLSSMSHELRTPLNLILGFAQVLEYDSALGAEQQRSVAEILKAGHHLLELINAVFDLARIDAGRLDLLLAPVALAPLADECRELIQPLAARRRIALHIELAPGLAVLADRMRLQQVLLNLLFNAVKYNRETGEIRLAARADAGGMLRLTVSDTGPGIAAERLQDIFKPFERLGAERSEIEGSGIGLTIAQRLVEAMGGSIEVASEVGTGTTFSISLPLAGSGDTHGDTH
ncbi:MAG: PAS domain-containing protein [Rhodocyclaceae bacterium]|nr:PAS domain-containing protein [Rhodocyclaceae bacterium]